MADIKELERAEKQAERSLVKALVDLDKAKKSVDSARAEWMKANKALTEQKVREQLRRSK
jgi:hypothetical protein